jgi:hypothetical protein
MKPRDKALSRRWKWDIVCCLKGFGVEKDFARVAIGSAVGCKTWLGTDLEDLVIIHFGFHEFICLKFNLYLDETVMISREILSLQFHDSPEKVGLLLFSDLMFALLVYLAFSWVIFFANNQSQVASTQESNVNDVFVNVFRVSRNISDDVGCGWSSPLNSFLRCFSFSEFQRSHDYWKFHMPLSIPSESPTVQSQMIDSLWNPIVHVVPETMIWHWALLSSRNIMRPEYPEKVTY